MRLPETPEFIRSRRRSACGSRRKGPGRTVIAGLIVVAAGLMVALVGAQMVVGALGPAGAIAAAPALSGVGLLCLGGLVECLGIAVFSRRLVTINLTRPQPAPIPAIA